MTNLLSKDQVPWCSPQDPLAAWRDHTLLCQAICCQTVLLGPVSFPQLGAAQQARRLGHITGRCIKHWSSRKVIEHYRQPASIAELGLPHEQVTASLHTHASVDAPWQKQNTECSGLPMRKVSVASSIGASSQSTEVQLAERRNAMPNHSCMRIPINASAFEECLNVTDGITSAASALSMAAGAALLLRSTLIAAAEHLKGPEFCPATWAWPGEAKAAGNRASLLQQENSLSLLPF